MILNNNRPKWDLVHNKAMKWISNKLRKELPAITNWMDFKGTSLNEPDFKSTGLDYKEGNLVSFLSALKLGYADMASYSFGVELGYWLLGLL
ncbi:unnamed protein product [Rhizophagus irregularis]|nr:unnamed protein product [Rhizophagus irregularis]